MKRLTAIGMVLVLLVGSMAWAQTRSLGSLQNQKRTLDAERRQLGRELRQTRQQVRNVAEDIREVDQRITGVEESIEATNSRLSQARAEVRALEEELEQAQTRLSEQRETVRDRLRAMYMHRESDPVVALLTSRDLGELAARRRVMELVAQRDRELFEEIRALRDGIEQRKVRQEQLVRETESLRARQREEQDRLESALGEKRDLFGDLRQRQSELEREYATLEAESRTIQAQIRAFQRSGQGERVAFRGSLIHPVPGARMSSGFGMRFHPVLRRNRMHNGVDFAAASGTPIKAAGPGTVISAGSRNGYGNTVVIDHGGGLSTLYAHCSRIYVRSGQRVTQGQRIAAVGSTGLSTGPHLHFEVRVNGSPVNPLSRL